MTIAEFCPRNVTHGGRTASPRAYKCMLISVSAWHFRKILSRKQVENTRPIYVNLIHFFVILIYSFVEPFKQRWADVDGYSLYSSPFQTNSPSAFWVRLFTWSSALWVHKIAEISKTLQVKLGLCCLQVVAHHDDLLQQATGIETLEGEDQTFNKNVSNLWQLEHYVIVMPPNPKLRPGCWANPTTFL